MSSALSPATAEGWFALHQVFAIDWAAVRRLDDATREAMVAEARSIFAPAEEKEGGGWSDAARLVGGGADLLFVHFRPDLDAIADVELRVARSLLASLLRLEYDYLSVTEAGLYHTTASVAAEHEPMSESYKRALAEQSALEASSPHVLSRIYPRVPEGMRYVSFYPMSKRREHDDNWYALPIEERSRLMRDHGLTGRRFAGKIFQVITGSVGFDDWEWGVTLFAHEPLEFKRIVTDMRYDEVSARYGEFGRFFTGIRLDPAAWPAFLSVA